MIDWKDLTITEYLYWGYLGASIVTMFISVIFIIRLYFFSLAITTVADVFLCLILFLISFYFRFNAFHYQKLLIENDK
ncbi:hypothetical protein G7081_01265 [Vagococcus coleopterorum]|uniref:Uncharacterized protein n=1 Tax=Vagococcus coleopterorum TaxID=2714946 RepID=A0A6G8ALL1_9ENTE|nr:hypothetical protein [Vagococcus coleopterorum]QIL45813.1 hypothetical protein G7081_01265 [Vagococcus coleopterorum]